MKPDVHCDTPCGCCRVSARDSGKPMVDAAFGEVMVTCEKIWWLVKEGARYLRPERRKAGAMVGTLQLLDSPANWGTLHSQLAG